MNFSFKGTFGCLGFSPDEKHLVYLAEKKEPKKQSFLTFGVTAPAEGTKVVWNSDEFPYSFDIND